MIKTSPRKASRRTGFTGKEQVDFDAHRAGRLLQETVGASSIDRRQRLQLGGKGPFVSDGRSRNGAGGLTHRLIQRTSFGWNLAEQQRADLMGAGAYLDEQLHPGRVDDFGVEQLVAEALPTTQMTPLEIAIQYGGDPTVPVIELVVANILRSLYSPRQLLQRTVDMWTDHFNVDLVDGLGPYLKPTEDRNVIRPHALGSFRTLLGASARSPAMLSYLTNNTNVKSHPNENYARELMELHTLGVDGGYTEADVKEVARCFTGWTFGDGENGGRFGQFRFLANQHDQGTKTVLGNTIAAGGGRADGERVLDILADHPSTASFVALKILRTFWGYEPPPRIIDSVAARFTSTGGNIRESIREALAWHHLVEAQPKLKRPLHYVLSAVRGSFAEVSNFTLLFLFLEAQGNVPYFWHPPNGYPDSEGYWSGLPLPRLDFALLAFEPTLSFMRSQLPLIDGEEDPDTLVDLTNVFLLNGGMNGATRGTIIRHLDQIQAPGRRHLEALALAIAAPEFQYY